MLWPTVTVCDDGTEQVVGTWAGRRGEVVAIVGLVDDCWIVGKFTD